MMAWTNKSNTNVETKLPKIVTWFLRARIIMYGERIMSSKCAYVCMSRKLAYMMWCGWTVDRTAFVLCSFESSTSLVRLNVNSFGMLCDLAYLFSAEMTPP